MLRFAAMFFGFAVVLFTLYQVSEATHRFGSINVLNAQLCSAVLRGVGVAAVRDGTTLALGTGAMQIISECSAIYVAILFTAAVLAYPTTWRARTRGLAFGLPSIFVLNVFRLVSLGLVIRYRASLLPLFHEYLWQVFFILVVAALYLVWIERMVPRARTRPAA